MPSSFHILLVAIVASSAAVTGIAAEPRHECRAVVIRLGREAGDVERNAAMLLKQRLGEIPQLLVRLEDESAAQSPHERRLLILIGIPGHDSELARAMQTRKLPPLTAVDRGPEGFLLHRSAGGALLAAGIDPRGVLYAVGEILRRGHATPAGFVFPDDVNLRTAPAFELRGTQVGQSSVALGKAKVRRWTVAEKNRKIADYALAGANTVEVGQSVEADDPVYRFLRRMGLKVMLHIYPNVGQGPPQWAARESIGRLGYLCPSVPAARRALLDRVDAIFRRGPRVDYVRFAGGDGGGCECDKCKPYGKTFILLCEDMARIIHRYHPKTEIFITNQKFDNADDRAIFAYLREKPRPWLRAFCYGPGSDAMGWQPGHRQTHRMDLFRYPGFSPYSRYLQEILHQLPPQQDLAFFTELTHWRYSQNGYVLAYPRPDRDGNQPPHWNRFLYERMADRFLTQVYDRLTFFAWPRYYHWMFGETVRYGIGDVTHSSGTQDHFNQWMWQRLLWDPRRGVEDVVGEYARTWFGPEAAPSMAKAVFLMEQYLQDDPQRLLPQKDEVDRYYDLVREAGARMPAFRRDANWLWREYMEKACVDKRTKLAVARQMDLQKRIETSVAEALRSGGDLDAAIDAALPCIAEARRETEPMKALRLEAERLGEESNALYGVRSDGIFSLDHDFIGLGWSKRQLERAKAAPAPQKREMLQLIADYENPGPGGFYDNCGDFRRPPPHLIRGYPFEFDEPNEPDRVEEGNRYSQRTMCYTQQEQPGVSFRYEGLDPAAQYRVRATLVRPLYLGRYAAQMNQHCESVYANDVLIAKDVEIPQRMSDFFTWDIPQTATRNGTLTLRFEKAADVGVGDQASVELWRNTGGWGTLVSEVWLMKK